MAKAVKVAKGKSATVLKGKVATVAKVKAAIVCEKKLQLGVDGGGFPNNKLMYLGAHMVNDPMLNVPKDDKDKDEFNFEIRISHQLPV